MEKRFKKVMFWFSTALCEDGLTRKPHVKRDKPSQNGPMLPEVGRAVSDLQIFSTVK
ncbi:hypothetical protein [Aeromonas veronii]|uniref:hypothetical protein n=1 Tax=Aeromonas veronii TaxID=654 RepID=UPI002442B79B|nr:hypothetical protein [Aeromonas veronii]